VVGGLVLNWFFTVPYGTFVVDRPDQLLVLAVYLAVAAAVSLAVGVAVRRTTEAARAKAEAEALSSLVRPVLQLSALPELLPSTGDSGTRPSLLRREPGASRPPRGV
jgi:two-component system, OmpR family, sensor histidine kinase KdpD